MFHSNQHDSTETVLKKCSSHLLTKKVSLHNFLQVVSSLLMHLEKSFQQIAWSIALVQFRWNDPCSAPRGHGKKAQLLPALFPSTASFKYEDYCKESYYDGEVISLWGTSPLTDKKNVSGTAPKTRLCKRSLSQLCPACWWLLVSNLQHTCLYSPAQCLQLVQCCSPMISLCTELSSAELLPVQSSSTFHSHTWLLLSKPNILHLSWLNCIQGHWTLLPACHILQAPSLSGDPFPDATLNLPKKLVKQANPMRLSKGPAKTH